MCFRILVFLCVTVLYAADERQLALVVRAESDFDRVELGVRPQLQETNGCVQSQVAAISVAARAELSLLYFRRGYCALVGATLTRRPEDFLEAAAAFDKSIEAWPDAMGRNPRNANLQPVSSGLRILASVTKLEADPAAAPRTGKQELSAAVETPACPSSVMPADLCQSMLAIGRQWLGWIALQQNDLYQAARELSLAPQTPWALWTGGLEAFHDRDYKDASGRYRQAVEIWTRAQQEQRASLAERLEPQPDMPRMWMQLGSAQILAGEPAAAIPALDAAIKGNPDLTRAIYYRARAEELSGRAEAALADYNLASRTAFANAQDLASGEAHLYRGILFYRRKDYAHAEDEFASALNFEIPTELAPDAQSWRHMAAVAGGSCGASRQLLEESLAFCSALFPKQEARALAATCPLSGKGPTVSGAF